MEIRSDSKVIPCTFESLVPPEPTHNRTYMTFGEYRMCRRQRNEAMPHIRPNVTGKVKKTPIQ